MEFPFLDTERKKQTTAKSKPFLYQQIEDYLQTFVTTAETSI